MSDKARARTELEERLRSALRGAADSVSPDVLPGLEETIRQRGSCATLRARSQWRFIAPLLAAGAVAAIALTTALLTPASLPGRHRTAPGAGPVPASAAEPKYLITTPRGVSPLQVRSAATGALVALVKVPRAPLIVPDLHTRRHFQIQTLATADGRTYVVGLFRAIPCTTRLYQFTLSPQGQPGPLTPFAALPVIHGAGIGSMAFSASGRAFAFSTISGSPACSYKVTALHIGFVNLVTKTIRQWSGTSGEVSLDFNGKVLAYSTGRSVMAIPTSAPPGPAAQHSRTLIRAAPYSRTGGISFAAITPDGKHVCFSIYPQRANGPGPGQIRSADLGSKRSWLVASNAAYQGLISADPRIRHLLLYIHNELVRLDLRSGKITPLPPGLRKYVGETFW
ncbi:MAG: hypothetical protein ACTHPS_28355 [Streptosporangiaceae bacterium]